MRPSFVPSWISTITLLILLPMVLVGCGRDTSDIIIAEVNGQRITMKDFEAELARIPDTMRIVYEQYPEEILDHLISLTLLLQEAKRKGLVESADLNDLNKPQVQEGIQRLLKSGVADLADVTDQEVVAYYQQLHQAHMEKRPLSEVREQIRSTIMENKQQQRITDMVARLQKNAAITTYPDRLPKPPPPALEASTANEFREALQSGRPTIVDLGSNHCPSCILLKPVLRTIKDAHGKQINVLFINIDEQKDLSRLYRVQFVPTVIFFDARGREVYRHVGFMDRKAIDKILHEFHFLVG